MKPVATTWLIAALIAGPLATAEEVQVLEARLKEHLAEGRPLVPAEPGHRIEQPDLGVLSDEYRFRDRGQARQDEADLVPLGGQQPRDGRPDEPGRAGEQHPHGIS